MKQILLICAVVALMGGCASTPKVVPNSPEAKAAIEVAIRRAAEKPTAIVLSSKEVTQPIAARYCWRNECFPNLFSKNGLPVEPFRTNSFELPEKNPK